MNVESPVITVKLSVMTVESRVITAELQPPIVKQIASYTC